MADVGGTSTDVGVLVGGFPRESAAAVEIGGIRTNFRMPDVLAIALGGGTIVRGGDGAVTLGPDSVGFELSTRALVFGGDTPTLTDAAVAAGRAEVGGQRHRRRGSRRCCADGLEAADALLADAIDRVKVGRGDRPLVLVGGGSVLVPDTPARACPRSCGPPTTTWRTRSARRSRWRAVAGKRWSRTTATAPG